MLMKLVRVLLGIAALNLLWDGTQLAKREWPFNRSEKWHRSKDLETLWEMARQLEEPMYVREHYYLERKFREEVEIFCRAYGKKKLPPRLKEHYDFHRPEDNLQLP